MDRTVIARQKKKNKQNQQPVAAKINLYTEH